MTFGTRYCISPFNVVMHVTHCCGYVVTVVVMQSGKVLLGTVRSVAETEYL